MSDLKDGKFSPEGRTGDLIGFLAKDAGRTPTETSALASSLEFSHYAKVWGFGGAVILALSFLFLPGREDLLERTTHFDTLILFPLWFLAALLPAFKVYSLAFPGSEATGWIKRASDFAIAPIVVIALFTAAHFSTVDLPFQMYRESKVVNGGCGLVIFTAGMIHAGFLFSWLKRGAPTRTAEAGAWAALSTGAFTSFIIQFACANEHPIHVLLWHFVPLSALTLVSVFAARKLLRW